MPPILKTRRPAARAARCMLAVTMGLLAPGALGQELLWPDYRGPSRQGEVPGDGLPLEWSETESVTWKTPIHGRGWSTPVITTDEIWLTTATADGKTLSVLALSLKTGKVLRDRQIFKIKKPQSIRNKLNSYSSPSPVLETGRIYVHWGTAGTACLDTDSGKVLWKRQDIPHEHLEGPGSSPVLAGDLLIFHADGADVQFVIALDKKTGETVWKTERSNATALLDVEPDLRKAYATPRLVETDERSELISTGARATMGYDPATGKELWRIDHPGFSMSARPVLAAGRIFINTGYMRPQLWAIRAGGNGNVTATHVDWKVTKRVPEMSSAVFANGHLFFASEAGIATCLEVETGRVRWQERIGGEHSASPIHHNGRIYFFDREGNTKVLAAQPEFKMLAENSLQDGFFASPAVANDALILRTTTHLYRIED